MMAKASSWIKQNMLDERSGSKSDLTAAMRKAEHSGRRITEFELQAIECTRRLNVPEWFVENNKPRPPLRTMRSIYERPPKWRTFKGKQSPSSPRKTPRKRSPRASPRKSPKKTSISGSSNYSTLDSGFNEAYTIRRRQKENKSPCISITSSSDNTDTETENEIQEVTPTTPVTSLETSSFDKSRRSLVSNFNTFPRASPSRRGENIEIVLQPPALLSPELVNEVMKSLSPKDTTYIMEKLVDVSGEESDCSLSAASSHASFLIADVKPEGVKTQVEVFADLVDSSTDDSEDDDYSVSRSPTTRFFLSQHKSADLERIVQERRRESGNRSSLLQEIIGDLESTLSRSLCSTSSSRVSTNSMVRGMIDALERSVSDIEYEDEEDCYDSGSDTHSLNSHGSSNTTDSDLARSTTISIKSTTSNYTSTTTRSEPREMRADFYEDTDVLSSRHEDDHEEHMPVHKVVEEPVTQGRDVDGVYWIPCSRRLLVELPRTSSVLSGLSSRGSTSRGSTSSRTRRSHSPSLSPILCREKNWLGLQPCTEKNENHLPKTQQPAWWNAYEQKVAANASRRQELFKIEEAIGTDSGIYSDDRSTPTTSMRSSNVPSLASCSMPSSATSTIKTERKSESSISADDERDSVASIPSPPASAMSFWEPSPTSSITSSPTKSRLSPRQFVLKSFMV